MTDETKGVREVADEIPYDYKVWAYLIRNNKALAMNVHVDGMLRVAQAANQSGTQYLWHQMLRRLVRYVLHTYNA